MIEVENSFKSHIPSLDRHWVNDHCSKVSFHLTCHWSWRDWVWIQRIWLISWLTNRNSQEPSDRLSECENWRNPLVDTFSKESWSAAGSVLKRTDPLKIQSTDSHFIRWIASRYWNALLSQIKFTIGKPINSMWCDWLQIQAIFLPFFGGCPRSWSPRSWWVSSLLPVPGVLQPGWPGENAGWSHGGPSVVWSDLPIGQGLLVHRQCIREDRFEFSDAVGEIFNGPVISWYRLQNLHADPPRPHRQPIRPEIGAPRERRRAQWAAALSRGQVGKTFFERLQSSITWARAFRKNPHTDPIRSNQVSDSGHWTNGAIPVAAVD